MKITALRVASDVVAELAGHRSDHPASYPEQAGSIASAFKTSEFLRNYWLVDTLQESLQLLTPNFCVFVGQYGLTAHLLMQRFPDSPIVSVDSSEFCKKYGERIFPGSGFEFISSSEEACQPDGGANNVIVCPSCHQLQKSQLQRLLANRRRGTIVALQTRAGEDRHDTEHIASLLSFADWIEATAPTQHFRGAISFEGEDYFMVIAQ